MPASTNKPNRKDIVRRLVASMYVSTEELAETILVDKNPAADDLKKESRGARIFDFIGKQWTNFQESRLGKVFAVLTGKALGRAVTIGIACLTIAGITGPAAPVVAIALGTLGLASVVIGAVIDTIKTRNIRKLKKENNLLVQNRVAKSTQEYILHLHPELPNILKDQLHIPRRDANQKSIKERYINPQNESQSLPKVLAEVALKQGASVAAVVISGVATGGISVVKDGVDITKNAGQVLYSIAMETKNKLDVEAVSLLCQKQIDSERDKEDTPGYNNLKELKQETREQRIQTMALKKLSAELYQQRPDGSFRKLSDEEVKSKFNQIKSEIVARENNIQTSTNPLAKILKSWGKDAKKAHHPFSQYNDASKINIQKHGELTKSVEAIKKSLDTDKYLPTKKSIAGRHKSSPLKLPTKSQNNANSITK